MSNNATVKEHPLAHILRAIADGVPVQYRNCGIIRPEWHDLQTYDLFWLTPHREGIEYRIKPKPKVKKWRWVVGYCNGSKTMIVTGEHFATAEEFNSKHRGLVAVQKVDSTMIEVDAD